MRQLVDMREGVWACGHPHSPVEAKRAKSELDRAQQAFISTKIIEGGLWTLAPLCKQSDECSPARCRCLCHMMRRGALILDEWLNG